MPKMTRSTEQGFAPAHFEAISGLTRAEAARLLARVGPNTLVPSGRKISVLVLLGRLVTDPMVLLLLVAGVTYLWLGDRFDAAVALGALVPIFLVNAVLEIRAERALDALRELAAPEARVVRDGREISIPASDVVPGDVMLVQEGDIFVADGDLIAGENLSCDESALTGESQPAVKDAAGADDARKILAGTTLIAGRGTVRVVATGARSEYGRIGKLLSEMGVVQTPLERAIHRLVYQLGVLVTIVCAGVVLLERWHGEVWAAALIAGVSLAMAAIPEELPMVYTLYLALGAWRLSKDHALVRRLSGVETLGATSVICVDKTGTLTYGRLELAETFAIVGTSERELLLRSVLASDRDPFDALDRAILTRARASGIDVDALQSGELARDYPFDAQEKYATKIRPNAGAFTVVAKGALETIAAKCALGDAQRAEIEAANERFAASGMRVIAVAAGDLPTLPSDRIDVEQGLGFLGLLAFSDGVRPGVAEELRECALAGIRVIMITGDHPATARAIARSLGLESAVGTVLTGKELERLDDAGLTDAIGRVGIFARTRPEQKLRIVHALHAAGAVVAMTDDGTNDALALREADIGIAMGKRGTEVARSAAGLVLLDDDFGTIVRAVRDGRRIFENLRRAFQYLCAFHAPLLLAALLLPLVGAPLLLLPVHLVWLELIVHPTSSLVFEGDPASPELMRKPPRARDSGLLERKEWMRPILLGVALAIAVLAIFLLDLRRGIDSETARSAALVAMIAGQMLLVFVERAPDRPIWQTAPFANRTLLITTALTIASLALAVTVPAIAHLLRLGPLTWTMAGESVLAAALATLWFEPIKAWGRRRRA